MLWAFPRKILWNSIGVETAFSTCHFLVTTCPEIVFQNILWNLHISDPDETNPPKGEADHDPLFLVRPMVDMMQRNFCTKYRPGKELSLDESTCPFKGRVLFKCYNPKSQTGSILNFLWSVNRALATFVALKFIQVRHLGSHRVMCRKYRMHQKLHALS